MTKLEWESKEASEQKRDFGLWEQRGKSRARPAEVAFRWCEHSSPVSVYAIAIVKDEPQSMGYDCMFEMADGSVFFIAAKESVSRDTQSEPRVGGWADLWKLTSLSAALSDLTAALANETTWYHLQCERRRGYSSPDESVEPQSADPESRCREIVECLQRADLVHDERRKLVLEAEVLPFRGQQAAALAPLLRQFIEEYRESNLPVDLVAVGSAIRNYVATAPSDDAFGAAANLLKAEGRLPLPIDLEVEIAKMVVRKLTANPPTTQDQYPDLAGKLAELAETYLNPRLLAREKHGAVALNAVLGIVLTCDPRASKVIARARTLGVPWFQQLLARRAARLRADLVARDSNARLADIARSLEQLSELDSPIPVS